MIPLLFIPVQPLGTTYLKFVTLSSSSKSPFSIPKDCFDGIDVGANNDDKVGG